MLVMVVFEGIPVPLTYIPTAKPVVLPIPVIVGEAFVVIPDIVADVLTLMANPE